MQFAIAEVFDNQLTCVRSAFIQSAVVIAALDAVCHIIVHAALCKLMHTVKTQAIHVVLPPKSMLGAVAATEGRFSSTTALSRLSNLLLLLCATFVSTTGFNSARS